MIYRILALLIFCTIFGQTTVNAETAEELYIRAKEAYDQERWVTAQRRLYAYWWCKCSDNSNFCNQVWAAYKVAEKGGKQSRSEGFLLTGKPSLPTRPPRR